MVKLAETVDSHDTVQLFRWDGWPWLPTSLDAPYARSPVHQGGEYMLYYLRINDAYVEKALSGLAKR